MKLRDVPIGRHFYGLHYGDVIVFQRVDEDDLMPCMESWTGQYYQISECEDGKWIKALQLIEPFDPRNKK